MENAVLETTMNVIPILNLLYKQGVLSIDPFKNDGQLPRVSLYWDLFHELFPDTEPQEMEKDGWLRYVEIKDSVMFVCYRYVKPYGGNK